MTVIRSLSGVGALVVGDQRLEGVTYRIDISRVGRQRLDAHGVLSAKPEDTVVLMTAFTGGHAFLEMEGGRASIVPSKMSLGSGGFQFAVSGPVPGFSV